MTAMAIVAAQRMASHLPEGVVGKIWHLLSRILVSCLGNREFSDSHPPLAKQVRLSAQPDREDSLILVTVVAPPKRTVIDLQLWMEASAIYIVVVQAHALVKRKN